ncbi:MAG: hypothetical protein ACLQJR_34570 [Stellaceae bacterium]
MDNEALRAKVHAASTEFDDIMSLHEAWKPTAYDPALHERIGHSYAANTFLVIRRALRREMLLGLTRLWDDDFPDRAVSMSSIGNDLADRNTVNALAAECAAQWGGLQAMPDLTGIPESEHAEFVAAFRRSEEAFGLQVSADLRKFADQAVEIIRKYGQGGACHPTLKRLTTLRNQHLAHRQLEPTPAEVRGGDATDAEIEAFYQDMSTLIRLLLHVVLRTSYEPKEGAGVFGHYAKFFWAAVRGERTEGHPNYRPHPTPS